MRRISLFLLLLLLALHSIAQTAFSPVKSFRNVVQLIKQDKAAELSKLIAYPLKRQNPLPDIATPQQFIAYFPTLFDAAFKKKLLLYDDSIVFEHGGNFGLVGGSFSGDIWMSTDGKIVSVSYSSTRETALRAMLIKKMRARIYPGVNHWLDNIMVAKAPGLLVRIDDTDKGTRYVAWTKGKPMSTKPDVIINKGETEPHGSQGGWMWTFNSGDRTYIVDEVKMCDDPKECGLFLRTLYKGVVQSTSRLTEIK